VALIQALKKPSKSLQKAFKKPSKSLQKALKKKGLCTDVALIQAAERDTPENA
jgi:hypothetical protein